MNDRKRILTGVRLTGPPHVGHYAGAIESWLTSQHEHDCYFHIADWQVSDHAGDLTRVRSAVWDVALDWLAAALDPERSSFVSECPVPEHTEPDRRVLVKLVSVDLHAPTPRQQLGAVVVRRDLGRRSLGSAPPRPEQLWRDGSRSPLAIVIVIRSRPAVSWLALRPCRDLRNSTA